MSIDLILGVASFSGIILLLVMVIILARSKLVSTGNVSIEINGDSSNPIVVPAGSKLLQTLADNNKTIVKEIIVNITKASENPNVLIFFRKKCCKKSLEKTLEKNVKAF